MLTEQILAQYTQEDIRSGEALAWVIGEDVLYDANISTAHLPIFLTSDRVDDVSSDYPAHDGITVRFFKDGVALEDFQTSEYFGSILLSSPLVVNLLNHKNGRHVASPNAKFINYEFVITNRTDYLSIGGWYKGKEPVDGQNAKCYSSCNCGWTPNV